MKNYFLLFIILFNFTTSQSQEAKIVDPLDQASFLLGMIDYPMVKATNEDVNKTLSTYLFEKKLTADLFLKTAKKLGAKELKSGKHENHYFITSKSLSDSLNNYLIFVNIKKFEDPFFNILNLKLEKFRYYIPETFKDNPKGFLSTLSLEGYPNPYLLNKKQQISFILGLVSTKVNLNPDIDKNINRGKYIIPISTYNLYYLKYIETIMKENGFEIVGKSGRTRIDEGQTCYTYKFKFNVPEAYEPFISEIIKSKDGH